MNTHILNSLKKFYSSKNILVTGGAGFIGSHIVDALISFGSHVTILDTLTTGNLENISHGSSVRFIHDTVEDLNACKHAAQNQDIIFHLAALTSVPESEREHERYQKTNICGTHNILQAAVCQKVKTFIFSSSAAVYGNQKGVCSEQTPVKPMSFYGLTKLVGEIFTRYFQHQYSLHTVCLRYFNVYGPRQRVDTGVMAQFRYRLENNLPVVIYGDGSQTRDFVHVSDVVKANLVSAMLQSISGEIINVASGSSRSIIEIFNTLKKELQKEDIQPLYKPARQTDIKNSLASCAKLREVLKTAERTAH